MLENIEKHRGGKGYKFNAEKNVLSNIKIV